MKKIESISDLDAASVRCANAAVNALPRPLPSGLVDEIRARVAWVVADELDRADANAASDRIHGLVSRVLASLP